MKKKTFTIDKEKPTCMREYWPICKFIFLLKNFKQEKKDYRRYCVYFPIYHPKFDINSTYENLSFFFLFFDTFFIITILYSIKIPWQKKKINLSPSTINN